MNDVKQTLGNKGGGGRASTAHGTLAGYRLVRSLGKGGLGEVFEAVAPDGGAVAIKTFELGIDHDGLVASAFVREASTGRRLQHPNIVKVLDSGCHGEYAYLVMEFVPGHDLPPHTRPRGVLPWPLVLRTAERIAAALGAAHAINVVHRDIKPGNVLVHWPSDTVKVTDFGLARFGDAFRSRTGIIAGTPSYMSPEQLAESPIGPASDLYSLGVVLFELLTGRRPHEATTLGGLLNQVMNDAAPAVRSLRPDLPDQLSRLVGALLAKRPEQRPTDARAVAEELARIAAG